MFRRTFVVVGIVECLQSDHWGWELIDSHGAGKVVCPFTTGRGVGTETCWVLGGQCVSSWRRPLIWLGHLWWFVRVYIYTYIYIYIYIYISLDIGRNMLLCVCWWEKGMACGGLPFSGTGCPIPDVDHLSLLCFDLCLGCWFYFLTTCLGCFCPRTLLFK